MSEFFLLKTYEQKLLSKRMLYLITLRAKLFVFLTSQNANFVKKRFSPKMLRKITFANIDTGPLSLQSPAPPVSLLLAKV